MFPPPASDFRRYPRLKVDLPVFRRVGHEFAEERVVSLSHGGLALASRSLLEPGSPVELVLGSRDGAMEIPVEGKVVWARTHTEAMPYLAGVRITHLDARAAPAYQELLVGSLSVPDGRRQHCRV